VNEAKRFYDTRGVPIYEGDLIRSLHFIGARRKRHWMYHVVVKTGDHLELVPTSHLVPSLIKDGGRCRLSTNLAGAEVIHGSGPDPYLSFEDRPRRKPQQRAEHAGNDDE
jgi:hypothetical protein